MSALDWSTPEGLVAIKAHLAARIDGWRDPVAWAVGISPATSAPEYDFPHVNAPGGRHGLSALVLASALRHDGSTATLPVSTEQLTAAADALAPAAAAPGEHPNLGAWRGLLTAAQDNPARELVAVFVADLEDPVSSDEDGSMRAVFDGLHPRS